MLETAHTILLISPSISSCSSSTSNSDPTSSISMSAKLVLRVEWNETVRSTRRDPFDTKKFSNLSPEILVEWKAPYVLNCKGLPDGILYHVRSLKPLPEAIIVICVLSSSKLQAKTRTQSGRALEKFCVTKVTALAS